jgi:hypothetical protein
VVVGCTLLLGACGGGGSDTTQVRRVESFLANEVPLAQQPAWTRCMDGRAAGASPATRDALSTQNPGTMAQRTALEWIAGCLIDGGGSVDRELLAEQHAMMPTLSASQTTAYGRCFGRGADAEIPTQSPPGMAAVLGASPAAPSELETAIAVRCLGTYLRAARAEIEQQTVPGSPGGFPAQYSTCVRASLGGLTRRRIAAALASAPQSDSGDPDQIFSDVGGRISFECMEVPALQPRLRAILDVMAIHLAKGAGSPASLSACMVARINRIANVAQLMMTQYEANPGGETLSGIFDSCLR